VSVEFEVTINGERLSTRIACLAEFGGTPDGGVHRVAFSRADIDSREHLSALMCEAGLKVVTDAAGNLIGRREGTDTDLPVILIGSHTDTVPQGGRYDGALGVLAALECLQSLNERKIVTRHPIEVIVFTDEEGGLIGSRALAGNLTPEALGIVTSSGLSVSEGIRAVGGDPDRLAGAARRPGDIQAYLELHIEQGGVLESKSVDIGVVAGIVGIRHWNVTVEGTANHAGTTPMDVRRDALLGAAHFILAVNQVVRGEPGTQVGTVGRIQADPGAPNVIPGRVRMSLELRDLSDEKIDSLFAGIELEADRIFQKTGTRIVFEDVDDAARPAPTDPGLREIIAESASKLGLSHLIMPSGAGHDAQEIARIAPIGMIFVPSVGGISHSPKEFTRSDDMANGAAVLLNALLRIDQAT
jgi:beta-ureidopropionase / N-carbamoyl-L-amino-acid hydrolase